MQFKHIYRRLWSIALLITGHELRISDEYCVFYHGGESVTIRAEFRVAQANQVLVKARFLEEYAVGHDLVSRHRVLVKGRIVRSRDGVSRDFVDKKHSQCGTNSHKQIRN